MAPIIQGCSDEIHSLYLEQAIFIPILIILQSSLLCQTIYYEYTKRHNPSFQKISKTARILYIILQLIGLYWTIIDLFRFVIDPYALILRDNIGCDLVGASPKYIIGPYYAVYEYQILLRLRASFRGSYLEISNSLMWLFRIIIIATTITGEILFFILNRSENTCLISWNPDDFPSDNITFCDLPVNESNTFLLIASLIMILGANAVFGIMFTLKLNKVLSNNKENHNMQFRFKKLIIKNALLTLIGSLSTITSYMLWLSYIFGVGAIFLYLDLFTNCLVIGLMFAYNDKWYKKLCKCFIVCLMNCDKSETKPSSLDVLKYVHAAETTTELETVDQSTPGSPRIVSEEEDGRADNNRRE